MDFVSEGRLDYTRQALENIGVREGRRRLGLHS